VLDGDLVSHRRTCLVAREEDAPPRGTSERIEARVRHSLFPMPRRQRYGPIQERVRPERHNVCECACFAQTIPKELFYGRGVPLVIIVRIGSKERPVDFSENLINRDLVVEVGIPDAGHPCSRCQRSNI
jgi:hypothetical protein